MEAAIYLGLVLPLTSCNLPGLWPLQAQRTAADAEASITLLDLAPHGVCRASLSPSCWWALTPPFHPYPFGAVSFCCTFRRLCCCQRYRLPVRKRVVQRSSDFPHNISVARLPVVPPYPTDQILPSSTAASTWSATSSGTSMRPHASQVYILSRLCFISIMRWLGIAE